MRANRTPWLDKEAGSIWPDIVAAAPKAEWVPQLEPGVGFSLVEYGCGAYGCVMPTADPLVVCKVTTDESEAKFVAAALQLNGSDPKAPGWAGVVRYHAVYRLPGLVVVPYAGQMIRAPSGPRPAFILWREAVSSVGISGLSENIEDYVQDARRATAAIDEALLRRPPDVTPTEHARVLFKRIAVSRRDVEKRAYVRGDEVDRAALGINRARLWAQAATEETGTGNFSLVGESLLFYLDHGILVTDLHLGNFGRHPRRVQERLPIITDPGQVTVFNEKWLDPKIATIESAARPTKRGSRSPKRGSKKPRGSRRPRRSSQ